MKNYQNRNIIQSASILKSIGHPIRVQIIIALSQKNKMTVTELSKHLSIDQPIMSLHLGVLRKNDVIKVKKDGKQSEYSIADTSVQQIINIVRYSRS